MDEAAQVDHLMDRLKLRLAGSISDLLDAGLIRQAVHDEAMTVLDSDDVTVERVLALVEQLTQRRVA